MVNHSNYIDPKSFEFDGLFVLDIANNHQGELAHGRQIISSFASVIRKLGVRVAIKFQFRQLDSFIHPDFKDRKDVPHIPRFLATRLSIDDFKVLINEARNHDFLTMCTPFDEESVDLIEELDFDAIKVASCDVTDLPLLQRVAEASMPTIASTGGANIDAVDRMIQIFDDHHLNYALNHCVAVYPTPSQHLQLNQIDFLKRRYTPTPIGWSTHENPNDTTTIQLAFAKGATFFERHIGMETTVHKLNKYSSSLKQTSDWIEAYHRAVESCGSELRSPATPEETNSLKSLMRGVYARRSISKGSLISQSDIFFAFPPTNDGLLAGDWRADLVSDQDYVINESLSMRLGVCEKTDDEIIKSIMLQVKGMLRDARVRLDKTSKIEISHHYGIKRFREFGAVIIDVINREYCKKLIVQLPRQKHPYHYHKRKEETFQILFGDLEVTKNGNVTNLYAGDITLIEPETWHKFSTLGGVVFEEISTTHYNDDSFYQDERISLMSRESRKTIVPNQQL